MGGRDRARTSRPVRARAGRIPARRIPSPRTLPSGFLPDLLFREARATLTIGRADGRTRPPVLVEESGCHVSGRIGDRPCFAVMDGPGPSVRRRLATLLAAEIPEPDADPTEALADRAASWTAPVLAAFDGWESELAREGTEIAGVVFEASVSAGEITIARRGQAAPGRTGREAGPAPGAFGPYPRAKLEARRGLTLRKNGRALTVETTRWAAANADPSPEALSAWRGAAAEALQWGLDLLSAVTPPAMDAPALFTPSATGILLHEICGHLLEADLIASAVSPFASISGQRVAPDEVTVLDDPRYPGGRVQLTVDDEAERCRSNPLIEAGHLRGYLSDRRTAAATGGQSTGNARRESYRHPPLPRMTNLVMAAGDQEAGDLLRGIARGLLVERLGRGQVDPRRGDFRLEVESGRLIENGAATRPLAGAFLVGSCRDLLMAIDGVGSDLRVDPGAGVCIKEDQIVPVGQAAPSVRVSRVRLVPGASP